MTLAWGVLVPLGVWSARYGKAPPGGSESAGSPRALVATRARLAPSRRGGGSRRTAPARRSGLVWRSLGSPFSTPRWSIAAAAFFGSAHSALGAATLVLGVAQPLGAYFRPTRPPRAPRRAPRASGRVARVWRGKGAPSRRRRRVFVIRFRDHERRGPRAGLGRVRCERERARATRTSRGWSRCSSRPPFWKSEGREKWSDASRGARRTRKSRRWSSRTRETISRVRRVR